MPSRDYYQPQRGLVSQNDRAINERATVPRSKFIGQWSRKMAFDAGWLVPFLVDEILPGDKMNYSVTAYVRMATPLFPLFDSQRIDTFFFFVPCRLVWDNWVYFMGEQDSPGPSENLQIPYMQSAGGGFAQGQLADHFGLPVQNTQVITGIKANALPFRAYHLIWHEWFRDQNIIDAFTSGAGVRKGIPMGNGPDAVGGYDFLHRRAKSHDYFTSALPWLQKFTAPFVALSGLAPVVGLGTNAAASTAGPVNINTTADPIVAFQNYFVAPPGNFYMEAQGAGATSPAVYADLALASGLQINDLRAAFMIQSMLERDARGGTRYVEQIRSHFGVTNPDFRLQRPEYIGGGQTGLQITPVAQTAPSAGVPVGALGAAATAAGQHRASYAATEHGYIIGLINVRTELSYQQGVHKMWDRHVRTDIYTPELALLGEQAIKTSEIYATGEILEDEVVFGYQERWQEYRTRTSEVTGIFRSGIAGTLDAWHLAQHFTAAPTLSQTFIEDTPDMERVLAAAELTEGQQYYADLLINRVAVRPLPMFGTPATLGRF